MRHQGGQQGVIGTAGRLENLRDPQRPGSICDPEVWHQPSGGAQLRMVFRAADCKQIVHGLGAHRADGGNPPRLQGLAQWSRVRRGCPASIYLYIHDLGAGGLQTCGEGLAAAYAPENQDPFARQLAPPIRRKQAFTVLATLRPQDWTGSGALQVSP